MCSTGATARYVYPERVSRVVLAPDIALICKRGGLQRARHRSRWSTDECSPGEILRATSPLRQLRTTPPAKQPSRQLACPPVLAGALTLHRASGIACKAGPWLARCCDVRPWPHARAGRRPRVARGAARRGRARQRTVAACRALAASRPSSSRRLRSLAGAAQQRVALASAPIRRPAGGARRQASDRGQAVRAAGLAGACVSAANIPTSSCCKNLKRSFLPP